MELWSTPPGSFHNIKLPLVDSNLAELTREGSPAIAYVTIRFLEFTEALTEKI